MARLYADEQFPRRVSELLRTLGHDVLTAQEAGNANLGIPDEEVLAFAVNNERAVLTLNRYDFVRLHRLQPDHAGIIVCTDDFASADHVEIVLQLPKSALSCSWGFDFKSAHCA